MDVRCEHCTHLFWVPGQAGGLVEGSCPNCGQPYRQQVPGINSEMELRDMVDPSSGKDMGGNPLQEGILGDWQNREVRDESFPGRMGAWEPPAPSWTPGQPGKFIVDPHGHVWSWLGHDKDEEPLTHAGYAAAHPDIDDDEAGADLWTEAPRWTFGWIDPDGNIRPLDAAANRDEHSKLVEKYVPGTHFDEPKSWSVEGRRSADRRDDVQSARTAEWNDDDIDFSLGMDDFDAGPKTQLATHKFIVGPGGRVLSAPEPTTHEQVAATAGQGEDLLKSGSLGWLYDDGSTQFETHASGLNPEELQQSVSQHFGRPVRIDPGLQPTTHDQRFQLDDLRHSPQERNQLDFDDKLRREHEMAEGRGGRPFGYYDSPVFNRGGSYLADPYPAWFEEPAKLAAGPGEVEAIPSEHGIHNDVVRGLRDLGASVNGRPVDQEWGGHLIKHYSPLGAMMGPDSQWEQNKGRPVVVGHEDPQALDAAKRVVETGSYRPVAEHHQAVNNAHTAEAQANPEAGFNQDVIKGLGFLDTYVDGRRVRDYYKQIAEANPGSVTLGASDPEKLEVARQVLATGSLEPAKAYAQAQKGRQGRQAAFLAPLAEGLGGRLLGGAAVSQLMGGAMGQGSGGGSPMSGPVPSIIPGGAGLNVGLNAVGLGGGGGGGDQQQAQQPEQEQIRGLEQLAAYDTPTTLSEIPGASTNDPEKVDPHEMNDGTQQDPGNFYDPTADFGGSQQPGEQGEAGPDDFDPDGPGMERLRMLMPLVQYYYENEESGAHDPLIQGLHQSLEMERPGYLEWGKAAHRESIATLPGQIPGVQDMAQSSPVGNPVTMPNAQQSIQTPGLGTCPNCGSPLAGNGQCATCGYGGAGTQGAPRTLQPQQQAQTPVPGASVPQPQMPQPYARVGGLGGPKTREQFQAVAEYLQQQGRGEEIPLMVENPDDYAAELAEVQQTEQPPDVQPPAQPTQPEMPPGPAAPAGAVPPDPSAQIAAAVRRHAVDNVAPKCPECDSHTTSLLNNNGDCRCSNCGHLFLADNLIPANPNPPKVADAAVPPQEGRDESLSPDDRPNVVNAPAADQERHRDVEKEEDPSLSWQDIDGQPLEEGKTYEMHERRFVIPDIVQITHVTPDEISYIPQGEYNLGKERQLKREDRELYDTEFVPVGLDSDDSADVDDQPDEQQATYPQDQPGQVSDLSHPTTTRSNVVSPNIAAASGETNAGADKVCSTCGTAESVVSNMTSPTEYDHDCYRCGNHWSSAAPEISSAQDTDKRSWLMGGAAPSGGIDPMAAMGLPSLPPQVGSGSGGGSRNITTLAGKKYDPTEQREFIDEPGTARNIDTLDLRGTHYESDQHNLDDELALVI